MRLSLNIQVYLEILIIDILNNPSDSYLEEAEFDDCLSQQEHRNTCADITLMHYRCTGTPEYMCC